MPVVNRPYTAQPGFTTDYYLVYDFLVRINQAQVTREGFPWGRWEWMFSRQAFDLKDSPGIGMWEENGQVVALATFEDQVGYAYLVTDPDYTSLLPAMFSYAQNHLAVDGKLKILIRDGDAVMQALAASLGFRPTQEREHNAIFPIDAARLQYALPGGYRVVSLAEELDIRKYNRVLWRGFNHPGEASESEETLCDRRAQLSGPHANLDLNIAVKAPNGDYAAYCGMWYLPGTTYALVEPVATDPDYRLKGLGKAAVLEAVKRCGRLGAQIAFVGSAQQFYYNIGFRPYSTETFWEWSASG